MNFLKHLFPAFLLMFVAGGALAAGAVTIQAQPGAVTLTVPIDALYVVIQAR